MTFSQIYQETHTLLEEVQGFIQKWDVASFSEASQIEKRIQSDLSKIISNIENLDHILQKETLTKRQNTGYGVDQLRYDCQHLQAVFLTIQTKKQLKQKEALERDELLNKRFHSNTVSDTSILIDNALQYNTSLHGSYGTVEELIETGTAIVNNLRKQKHFLKGTQRKILDIAATLGMSNTVMRLIERRVYQDKFVLYGGILFTCIIMIVVWKFLV